MHGRSFLDLRLPHPSWRAFLQGRSPDGACEHAAIEGGLRVAREVHSLFQHVDPYFQLSNECILKKMCHGRLVKVGNRVDELEGGL